MTPPTGNVVEVIAQRTGRCRVCHLYCKNQKTFKQSISNHPSRYYQVLEIVQKKADKWAAQSVVHEKCKESAL